MAGKEKKGVTVLAWESPLHYRVLPSTPWDRCRRDCWGGGNRSIGRASQAACPAGKGTPPPPRGAETAARGEAGVLRIPEVWRRNAGAELAVTKTGAPGIKVPAAAHAEKKKGKGGAQTLTDELSAAEVIV